MNTGSFQVVGLGLLSAAVWGGGDFAGGIAAKRVNVFRAVALAQAVGLLSMLLLAWLTGEPVPPGRDLAWGALAGITGTCGIASLYQGLAIGRMGIVAPVAAVVSAIIPVLVGMRLEGAPAPLQLAGFVLAVASIWLIARPDGQVDTHRGLGLAILAGGCFGLFLVCGKQAGHHVVFWPMVAARMASVTLMSVLTVCSPPDRRPLRPALASMLVSGLFDAIGNALFIAATRHGRLDVASVLSSLYPASTVVLARVLLKERISRLQTAGIVGALIAVALISSR